jgi:hypothetical protein
MRLVDILMISIEAMRVAPLRAALSVVSFMIGIAAPTFIFGVSNGMALRVAELAEEDFRRKLNIVPSWEVENTFVPTTDDVALLQLSGIQFEHVGASLIRRQIQAPVFGQLINIELHGITPDALAAMGQSAILGRAELQSNEYDATDPCIINRPLLEALDRRSVPHEIRVQRWRCSVVGLVEPEPFSGRERPILYLPIETARRAIQDADTSNSSVALGFSPRRSEAEVDRITLIFPTYYEMVANVERIKALLNERRQDASEQITETQVRYTSYDAQRQERAINDLNLFLIIVMTLVVVFVVLTVGLNAYYAVRDRAEEIAIQFALGAKQIEVVGFILIESFIYILIGGLLGGLLATQLSAPFSDADGFRVAVDVGVLINSSLVLLIAGTLASCSPAWHASRVNPASALKA